MDQNINDYAKSLIEAHQKPIVRLNIGGVKRFLPQNDNNEPINNNLEVLKRTLSFPRVDRRNLRSQGLYLPQERLILIKKLHNIQNVGFRNKSGMYFNLEEALYFLETNRLEVFWNNTPISIQQAYYLFIDDLLTLDRYKVYKKCMTHSFQVARFKEHEEPPLKKPKLIDQNEEKNEKMIDIFKQLKEKAPKQVENVNVQQIPVYSCINPRQTDLNNKYNVHIVNQEMDPKIGFYAENVPNLFAITTNDDIPLYRISKVSLPCLF
nr:uncharacterized protein LOC111419395 [Onthophagus taurus]